MKLSHILGVAALALVATMCTPAPKLPKSYKAVDRKMAIYPDYDGVTIPVNIAPLNFVINDSASAYVTHIHAPRQNGFLADGKTVDIDIDSWRQLLLQCQGDTVLVDIYARQADGSWLRHLPMRIAVSEDSIDPYISYRKIEPSYIGFEQLQICQRHLESFDESEIFNNCTLAEDENGQCINCHSYQDYNRGGNMQMHVRINHGGTVIAHDGKVQKVNLKTPATISGGVYPSWHPTLPLIAYSVNKTTQNFHENHNNKVEVQDGKSDIVLYDVANNQLHIIQDKDDELESFPYWNHDGTALYFVSANVPVLDDDKMRQFKARAYKAFKYNILRKPFDAATLTFGATDTVYKASAEGFSATFPRESPDGRFLLFTRAPYGTFHIWHKDADLMLLDLHTGELRALDEVNSPNVESYHSFSSNGRWVIFSSRREDGSFTRLYMTHFGPDGRCTKPFLLPQRDPKQNKDLYKSYNIPEFMVEPVAVTRPQFIDAILADALDAELADPASPALAPDAAPTDTTETFIY